MLRRIRTRTTPSVVAEIEHLYREYGLTGAMLHDDELNVNKNVVELMNAIDVLQKRLGVEFRFRGFIKAELFTEEQADAMYRAGFRILLCGFEAAHPRILENIQKKATLEDNTRVVEICRKYGLQVKALMSVGHAGESEESILSVRDWLLEVKPDDFDCTVISTYPGTPYYDEALPHPSLKDVWTYTCKKSGDRLHAYDVDYMEVADYYKGDPEGGYKSYVFTDHLTAEDIVRLRDQVEREVRDRLKIPFNPGAPGIRYEHSMGASGPLPPLILRSSGGVR
jgi:anaerobic magnesium-protoporphyrin IX monomethyl ester cyclase